MYIAIGAVTRLIDIGVKPFLVASSTRCLMAQRLVRKICKKCGQPYTLNDKLTRAAVKRLKEAAGEKDASDELLARGRFHCLVCEFGLKPVVAIFVRVLLTWLPIGQDNPIVRVLFDVTEPVLAPFRKIIPRIGMFDLSPIAAMLIIQLILQNLPQIFRGLNAG